MRTWEPIPEDAEALETRLVVARPIAQDAIVIYKVRAWRWREELGARWVYAQEYGGMVEDRWTRYAALDTLDLSTAQGVLVIDGLAWTSLMSQVKKMDEDEVTQLRSLAQTLNQALEERESR